MLVQCIVWDYAVLMVFLRYNGTYKVLQRYGKVQVSYTVYSLSAFGMECTVLECVWANTCAERQRRRVSVYVCVCVLDRTQEPKRMLQTVSNVC